MFLPSRTDNFASATWPGDKFSQYLPFIPGAGHTYGRLADFYNDGAPHPTGEDGVTDDPVCYMARGERVENVIVEGVFSLRTSGPLQTATQVTLAGVFARIQGGTLAGGGTIDQRWSEPDCYAFTLRGIAGASFTFAIERWVGGVKTDLATLPLNPLSIPDGTFDATKPFTLRLEVVNDAGNPKLSGWITDFSGAGASVPGLAFQVFNPDTNAALTDSSASKITGVGYAGFGAGQDEIKTIGVDIFLALQVRRFSYTDNPATTTHLFDDFTRTTPSANLTEQLTSDFGFTGPCVMSRYLWDLYSAPSYAAAVFDVAPVTAGTAQIDSPSSTERKYVAVDQRPPNSIVEQHPEILFRFEASGTSRPGVAARVSGEPGANLSTWSTTKAYIAVADITAGYVSVWRLPGGLVSQDLATELGRYTVAMSTGVYYRLGLRVTPVNPAIIDGPQLLELFWNDAQVAMVLQSAVFGVEEDGSGGLIDSSSARVLTGNEGIVCWQETTAAVTIDAWDEGPVTTNATPAADQASISLASEPTSEATLDFWDVQVEAPVQHERGRQVVRHMAESGHSMAHARHRSGRKVWERLKTAPMSTADKDTLLDFWRARSGAQNAFTWTNPEDNASYRVQFVPSSFETAEIFRDIWECRFGLRQVL